MPMSTEEAVSIIRSAVERFNSGGKLRSVFRTFDRNRDGYISLPEFSLALSEIGVRFETAVVKRVFDVFDRSGEGKMAYFEFVSQMSGPSSSSASSSSSVHRSSHQSATLKPSSSEQAAVLSSMSHPAVLPNDMSIDDILHKVCVSLSDAEQGRLRSVFRSIDRDGNGLITVSELAMALNRLHFSLEAGVVQKIFDLFDQDGNHYISYSEFVAAIARATHPSSASASAPAPESASASLSPAERQRLAMRKLMQQLADAHLETKVAAVFERIDTNNSGTITFVEFVAALRSMKGVDVPVASIRDAFKFFDHDQNGFIIISEFIMSMGHIRNNTPRAPVSVALRGVGRGPNDSIALTDDADTATAASIIHDAISYNSMGSDMREFFERYDYNGQGVIEANEFLRCLVDMNISITQGVFDRVWNAVADGDEVLRFPQFVKFVQGTVTIPRDSHTTPVSASAAATTTTTTTAAAAAAAPAVHTRYRQRPQTARPRAKRAQAEMPSLDAVAAPAAPASSQAVSFAPVPLNANYTSTSSGSERNDVHGEAPHAADAELHAYIAVLENRLSHVQSSVPSYCSICHQWFTPQLNHPEACAFHPGSLVQSSTHAHSHSHSHSHSRTHGHAVRRWSCCGLPESAAATSAGCTLGQHMKSKTLLGDNVAVALSSGGGKRSYTYRWP